MAASRITKGLFFISTLLCLICFVSSTIDKDQEQDKLDKFMKASVKFAQQMIQLQEMLKTDSVKVTELFSDYMTLMDRMISSPELKELDQLLPDDFPSVDALMDSVRTFLKGLKAYMERETEKFRKMKTEF